MSKDYIIKTFKAFQPQLEAMIEAEGGHIEDQKRLMNFLLLYDNESIDCWFPNQTNELFHELYDFSNRTLYFTFLETSSLFPYGQERSSI